MEIYFLTQVTPKKSNHFLFLTQFTGRNLRDFGVVDTPKWLRVEEKKVRLLEGRLDWFLLAYNAEDSSFLPGSFSIESRYKLSFYLSNWCNRFFFNVKFVTTFKKILFFSTGLTGRTPRDCFFSMRDTCFSSWFVESLGERGSGTWRVPQDIE